MKRTRGISYCVLLLMISCHKNIPKPFGDSIVTAVVNGRPWQGTGSAVPTAGVAGEACNANTIDFVIANADAYPDARLAATSTTLDCIRCDQTQSLFFTKVHPAISNGLINQIRPCRIDTVVGASYHTIIGGDAGRDAYYVWEDAPDNRLAITTYNPGTGELLGTFQVTFLRDRSRQTHGAADTLRFRQGSFHMRIKR